MNTLKVENSRSHRNEIDGLRALAVISVVVGHFFPRALPNGYLGVDVFFVISGYVITQLLVSLAISKPNRFLFEFYAKRCRRILPALLVVVVITYTFALLLISRSVGEITNTGAYSIIGISNLYLLHISYDYFGISAANNPFTHTWSLGVEEQFYIIYPLLILLLFRIAKKGFVRYLLICISILSYSSLVFSIFRLDEEPNQVFYSMPTRVWEFGLGAIAFLAPAKLKLMSSDFRWVRVVGTSLIAMTLYSEILTGLVGQILVTSSTALLLAREREDLPSKVLSNKVLLWIGLRSYSIYLIHWPVLVFSNYLLGAGGLKNFVLIPMILMLSSVNYRFIETPFRTGKFYAGSVKTVTIGCVSIFCVFLSLHTVIPNLSKTLSFSISELMRIPNVPTWTSTPCSGRVNTQKFPNPLEACLGESDKNNKRLVYLIGDSHADQFVAMVQSSFSQKIYKVKNINLENEADFPFGDFRTNSTSASLRFVVDNAKKGDIVILTFHRGHLNQSRDTHISLRDKMSITFQTQNLIDNLNRFSKSMAVHGVKVILIKDTPLMNSIQTSESCALQQKILGRNGCRVTRIQDEHTRYLQSYAFDSVARNNENVLTWDPFKYIYRNSDTFDPFKKDGSYTMWDWNHITRSFSFELARNFRDSFRVFVDNN